MLEEFINQISQSTSIISKNLSEISKILDKPDLWGIFGSAIISIISVILGYFISTIHEKIKIHREYYREYLRHTNIFLFEVNKIITEALDLKRIVNSYFDFSKNKEVYNRFIYDDLSDLNSVKKKIYELRKEIDKTDIDMSIYSDDSEFKNQFIEQASNLLERNRIRNFTAIYDLESSNYRYLISKKLWEEHENLLNQISKATKNNLIGFNIEEYKKNLCTHIFHINKKICFFIKKDSLFLGI